jgi:hypothetical protein
VHAARSEKRHKKYTFSVGKPLEKRPHGRRRKKLGDKFRLIGERYVVRMRDGGN